MKEGSPETSSSSISLSQDQMDYRCLKDKMTGSSLANFNAVVSMVKQTLPGAIFDDSLARSPGMAAEAGEHPDESAITCNLAYLFHL